MLFKAKIKPKVLCEFMYQTTITEGSDDTYSEDIPAWSFCQIDNDKF